MPTYNRRAFVSQAIHYFLRQSYSNKELIIVDDGTDTVSDLVPIEKQIRYVRVNERVQLGAKRNLACEHAHGHIIMHWDDDDWYASDRICRQVEALLLEDVDVCGISTPLFYDKSTQRAWRYRYPAHQKPWVSGSSLCYLRSFWSSHRFLDVGVGEDAYFVWSARAERVLVLADSDFLVAMIHPQNSSSKQTQRPEWIPYPLEGIKRLLLDDWSFYHPDQARAAEDSLVECGEKGVRERRLDAMIVARAPDLNLPEYAAFNHQQALPWMRRWESAFALFHSQLSNNMSVLDCTINPVNFEERLMRLYPHTLYRRWSPIQNGQFALPLGVPDGAFDRVICINTLEHLLKPQREALVAAMARKLKRGGRLILTSDYYFDASWRDPAFLQIGVMREDRQEILNGWNKVTPRECLALCRQYDLYLASEPSDLVEPREDDRSLYLQQAPYRHACIAGIFHKSVPASSPAGKRVVLALLMWNTRHVSLESVRAYLGEARMLVRLGQSPFLCLVENGSTDGTADALCALEPQIDIPHKLILNHENLGNSVARNQIIEYMRECDADYLLFMDGDIEVVPFSSFAMLRYVENNGHRLGCIGADSGGQTPYRERASACLYSVEDCRIEATNLVAWTQYGMFRREVFEDGLRFDETGPFHGPGWGFEDNDFAFQMETKGYLNQRFIGITYLHRNMGSSIHIMRNAGIDVGALYAQRRNHIITKWSAVPQINNGPLAYVQQVSVNL